MTAPTLEGGPAPAGADDWLAAWIGLVVVADLREEHLAIGTLQAVDASHLVLTDADLHDHREANCSKDMYLIESRTLGVRINRRQLCIPRANLIAISRLEDIAL